MLQLAAMQPGTLTKSVIGRMDGGKQVESLFSAFDPRPSVFRRGLGASLA
jgi:hypothetical protein